MALAAGLIAVAAAGTGGGLWLTSHHSPVSGSSPLGQATTHARPASSSSVPSPASSGSTGLVSPTVSASPSASGTIEISAAAAASPEEPAVATLVSEYFMAINAHDYQGYLGLLVSRSQAMTRQQFDRGYRSTVDSSERLLRISTAPNGDVVAVVTFVSHQNPADSVDGKQACTNWRISLFLLPAGSGYLIDQAPPGYHASYSPC